VEVPWRRGGFSVIGSHSDLYLFEAVTVYRFPWELRSAAGWGIATQAEGTMGVLAGEGDHGFIASAGPSFAIGKDGFPLELLLGVSAAFLSRDSFGDKDYNGDVQFSSHAGLNYRISRRIGVGYRFQHMSNAGMNGYHNPGVNLHLFGVDWYFSR
jgi:hypothetical protein